MLYVSRIFWHFSVTLCEESVDWNKISGPSDVTLQGHSLRGECGLKFFLTYHNQTLSESLSARRVWIEIIFRSQNQIVKVCHSLRGECGLKFFEVIGIWIFEPSLSARRVWIEIYLLVVVGVLALSLSARRVWIEISMKLKIPFSVLSLSARRVWIEIN